MPCVIEEPSRTVVLIDLTDTLTILVLNAPELFSWLNSARWEPLMVHVMLFTKHIARLVNHCDEFAYPLILFHCVNNSL